MNEPVQGVPIGEVLDGLSIPPLPANAPAKAAFVMAMYEDEDGDDAWVARVTHDVGDDELLGVLVGYVEHLKRLAATNWTFGSETATPPVE